MSNSIRDILREGFQRGWDFKGTNRNGVAVRWYIFWLLVLSAIWICGCYSFAGASYYDEKIVNTCLEYYDSPYLSTYEMYESVSLLGAIVFIGCLIFISIPTLAMVYREGKSIWWCIGICIAFGIIVVVETIFAGILAIIIIPNL